MVKTPILTGTETCVTDLGGQNVAVQNLSGDTIWASAYPGVMAGADDVYEIPAGGGVVVLDAHGTIYLLGTGKVQVTGTDYATPNFKMPSSSSGGGTGDVTKVYVDTQDSSTLDTAKTYTDTAVNAVKTDVTANADDIADLQTAITTLNGTGTGSVTKAVADGIAEVVAGAPESFDTLKEISDWISSHSDSAAAMNSQIQANAADIEALGTAKADKTELPTTLPANGGNADTVNGHTVNADVPENAVFTDTVYSLPAATKTALGGVKVGDNLSVAADGTLSAPIYSNPNLLDNPDFKINQRGVSGTITAAGYFVDRWKLKSGSVTINANKTLTLNGTIEQILETAAGTNVTASSNAGVISYNNSTKTVSLTGQNVTVSWVKLELGNKATPFVPPSPSKEFIKCLYYYEKSVSTVWASIPDNSAYSNLLMGITFVMPKRIKPSIKLFTLYHNGVDASSTYFNSISTAAVSISDMYPQYRVTNGILTTKQAPVKNDFSYKIVYEASADL